MSRVAEEAWRRIVAGESLPFGDRLAELGLRALAKVYGGALGLRRAGYRYGLVRRTRLAALTISIGNLTVGGTGKTTACLAVARWLCAQGRRVALLSRGYRGGGEDGALVVSEESGPTVDAQAAGDEAYLLAQALPGLRVLVGRNRRRTGLLAVTQLGADTVLLDDGFQHQRLARDLDIVLVDALAPFGYHYLVPRGLLREPVSQLARAGAVWLTHCDLVGREDLDAIRARVRAVAPQARVWETRHAPVGLRRLDGEERFAPEALRGRRVCALSGVGNPCAFERSLQHLGAEVVRAARFPDHHRYAAGEVRQACREPAAEWVITTEKDAVRLPPERPEKPTWVLEIALASRPGQPELAEELGCLLRAKNLL